MDFRDVALLIGAAFLLPSCGDGDSAPPPPNSAPRFTSETYVSVEENVEGSIYVASATDSDGDALSFSIAGGPDASAFAITSAGRLSFISAPNFEAPSDSNVDNRYELTLSVSDGRASSTLAVSIDITNLADAVTLKRIAQGMGETIDISAVDTENLLIIGNASGDIFEFNPTEFVLSDTGNIFSKDVPYLGSRLVAMTANKGYTTRRSIAVLQASPIAGATYARLRDYRENLSEEWYGLYPFASQEITAEQGRLLTGTVVRGVDEFVYFFAGDGGEPDRALEYRILGNVIKIGPARYPCPGVSCGPAFYRVARGLHDPIGAVRLGETMYFVDRGETRYDEINQFQTYISSLDFGWPYREGRNVVRAGGTGPFVDPTLEFNRDTASLEGFVAFAYYEGDLPGISGKFLLASSDGRFFALDPSEIEFGDRSNNNQITEILGEFSPDTGTLDNILKIVVMAENIYVLDGDGELFVAVLETL